MINGVAAVMFEGSYPRSEVEEMIACAREAALLDNLLKLKQVEEIEEIYIYTNRARLAAAAEQAGVKVFLNSASSPARFHFGNALQEAVAGQGLSRVLCLNGAGCPLITVEELVMICRRLLLEDNFVYTNNTQSSDISAFTVPHGFAEADLPATDNGLALTLRDALGLRMELMPHSLGLLFDLDTPADLLILGAGPFCGPRVRSLLDSFALDYSTLERAKLVLQDEYRDIALIGRVGAPVIARLNAVLKLRLRVFSEERGMKALGRIEDGNVISLLGLLLEHAGLPRFFDYLAQVAECAFIDNRVLMYHFGYHLSDRERFLSDLGRYEQLENPWLKEFTRQAAHCKIPVVTGGHSLVSGSLWALCNELKPEEEFNGN